jgi:flagellar basal body-associated protein FliL
MRSTRRRLTLALAAALVTASAAPAWAQPSASGGATTQDRQSRLTSAESFLPMPTFSAGILRRSTAGGTLVVDMGLDIPDETLRRRAQMNEPRLRDALRTALSNNAS